MKPDFNNEFAIRYFESVRRCLPASKEKKAILLQLENSLFEFLQENPGAGLSDFEARFGSPSESSECVTVSLVNDELQKKIERSCFVKKLLLSSFMALLVIVLVTAVIIIVWNALSDPTVVEEKITTVLSIDYLKWGGFSL